MIYGRAAHIAYILRTFIFLGGMTCSSYNYAGTQRLGFLTLSTVTKASSTFESQ